MLVEPPRNGGYLAAAYIVAPTILLGYWLRLLRQARRLSRQPTTQEARDEH
jgi:hypothetical protein